MKCERMKRNDASKFIEIQSILKNLSGASSWMRMAIKKNERFSPTFARDLKQACDVVEKATSLLQDVQRGLNDGAYNAAITSTDVDVGKILDTITNAKERAELAAKNCKQRSPSYMKQIQSLVSDPDKLRKIRLSFSTISSETDATIKLINSAIRELNKGSLSTCAKYMKLAIAASYKVRREFFSIDRMPVTGKVIGDVMFEAWRVIMGPLGWAKDQLEKVLREVGN